MIDEKNNYEDIIKDLKTAIICIAAISAVQVIYYTCDLFNIINFNIDKTQNIGIYSGTCLGIAGYCWRQLAKLKKIK